jgi:hypothetical protein
MPDVEVLNYIISTILYIYPAEEVKKYLVFRESVTTVHTVMSHSSVNKSILE